MEIFSVAAFITAMGEKRSVFDYIGICILGGAFFLLSVYSEEKIGLADAWMIAAVLLLKGFLTGFAAVLWAFLAAGFISMGLLLKRWITGERWKMEKRFPFFPCLLIGYLLVSF